MIDYLVWLAENKHNGDIDKAQIEVVTYHQDHYKPKNLKLPDNIKIIKGLLDKGLTLKEIGEQYGATRQAVSSYLKRNGIVLKKGRLKNKRLKPVGCDECIVSPFVGGLCKNCYQRDRYRKRQLENGS